MKKIFLLAVSISAYVIVMSQSVSAVEYRVVDDHHHAMMFSSIENIDNTLDSYRSIFLKTIRDLKWFSSTQNHHNLIEKIRDVKKTMENTSPKSAGILLIFQLLIAVLAIVIFIIFGIGATLIVAFGSLATSAMVALMSLIIILSKIITPQ